MDLTPYEDRTPKVQDILQVLGPDHEVSSKGTSKNTAKFAPELTTLKLIMFSNLYLLSNTAFINLGRAQFLSDLITGAPIDICAHIFQIIGKTAARSTTRACIPFCSLIMKIMLLEGVSPPSDGKMMNRPRPISMISLHASKSHSSKTPKSEHISPATSYAHESIHMCIPRLFLLSPLSYSQLAISQYSLILKQIGWVYCLKIFICALPELKDSSTPPTIKSNYALQPWRIS